MKPMILKTIVCAFLHSNLRNRLTDLNLVTVLANAPYHSVFVLFKLVHKQKCYTNIKNFVPIDCYKISFLLNCMKL